MLGHRRRRATQRSPATTTSPEGCGPSGPLALSLLLDDVTASSRRRFARSGRLARNGGTVFPITGHPSVTISRAEIPPLYALTDASSRVPGDQQIHELITAGVRWIQIREKSLEDIEFYEIVRSAVASLPAKVKLFVNDRLDIALACTADGVHLGGRDLPVDAARRVAAAAPLLIGFSTHSLEEARHAAENPFVDYVAIGPIFSSPTKAMRSPLGVEVIAQLREETDKPIVAIGGIDAVNIRAVLQAGADAAAVISALYRGGSIGENVRQLIEASGKEP